MVSHQHKCIFIHIPKCAGTSIESALGHLEDYQGRNGQDHRSVRLIKRSELGFYTFTSVQGSLDLLRRVRHRFRSGMNPRNKIQVNPMQFTDYFKFTIVRNPWSRAWSMYRNVIRDEIHRKQYGIPETIPFKEFMHRFAGKGMLRPQTYWLEDAEGNIPMDFIGRFENLEADFQKATELMGLKNISLPHKIKGDSAKNNNHKNGSEHYLKHYDNETHDLVGRLYADEISRFGYAA